MRAGRKPSPCHVRRKRSILYGDPYDPYGIFPIQMHQSFDWSNYAVYE